MTDESLGLPMHLRTPDDGRWFLRRWLDAAREASPAAVIVTGAAIVVAAVLATLTIGVIHVPLADVARSLGELFSRPVPGALSTSHALVVDMRLPRALGAVCVGASMGAAGCMLQALLRNPLASPTVIGTAQGAGFGKVLGVFLGLSYVGDVSFAFLFAVLGGLLVYGLARTRRGLPTDTVVLTGLNISLLFGALTGLVQYLSRNEGELGRMVLMLFGGLWQVTWGPLALIGPAVAVAVAASYVFARRLDLLSLGEADARRLGLDFARTATAVLLLSCLLTALAVCLAGVVAFVGLVVPHAARRIVGPAHSRLLPASALLGALVVVATDTLARTAVPPNELPLGMITSLVGVPCFLWILRSIRTRRAEA